MYKEQRLFYGIVILKERKNIMHKERILFHKNILEYYTM